jgi:uncharacterized protein YjbI with pentapeptide repeats
MANPEHVAKLKEGIDAWNQWRKENPDTEVDLSEANLSGATLPRANLHRANLRGANLNSTKLLMVDLRLADLAQADLSNAYMTAASLNSAKLQGANLSQAHLSGGHLNRADLSGANLTEAKLFKVEFSQAILHKAILRKALLVEATLRMADLSHADLREANLYGANLQSTNLSNSDLSEAQLSMTNLVRTNFEGANLSGCGVYGVSVWDVRLKGAIQSNLVVTPDYLPTIQVDNLDVAQFVYLLLSNEKIRHVIDTITSKVVLILGRFTGERKLVLDAIRDELRKRDYLPILFDFQKPESKDLTGTVTTLANLARFVIADLTDPSSVPHELVSIAPGIVVPVQTLLLRGQREYSMFADLKRRYHWVLEPYQYESQVLLMENLDEVINPAEAKAEELRGK